MLMSEFLDPRFRDCDEGYPVDCTMCGGQIDNGYGGELIEVDGFSECLDCLMGDPEIADELRETHPHLFD